MSPQCTRECHVLFGTGSNVNFAHLAHSEQRILTTCQVKVELSVLRKELKELFDGLSLPVSTSIVYVCIHLFISTVVLACVAICCCSSDGLSYTHVMLIIMDGERNHSMGNPMNGTPSQSEDQ